MTVNDTNRLQRLMTSGPSGLTAAWLIRHRNRTWHQWRSACLQHTVSALVTPLNTDACRPKEPSQQRSGSPVHDEDVFNGVFTVNALYNCLGVSPLQ